MKLKFFLYILFFNLFFIDNLFSVKMSPENYNYGEQQNPVCALRRKHSLPYITGDTFRFFSDHTYDEVGDLNPLEIKNGDTVFVSGWFLHSFFEKKHPFIQHKYILITGNSDIDIDEYFLPYLQEERLQCFFATNVLIKHEKLIPIPIGCANSFWSHGNIKALCEAINIYNNKKNKDFLLILNFDPRTNIKVRGALHDFFSKQDYCKVLVASNGLNKQNYVNYLRNMGNSSFVISPFGNGLDCYRVWEACLLGCIPIVQTSSLDELYSNLPILIVEDYFKITEGFLKKKLLEIKDNISNQKYNMNKLYFEYWLDIIKKSQAEIKNI